MCKFMLVCQTWSWRCVVVVCFASPCVVAASPSSSSPSPSRPARREPTRGRSPELHLGIKTTTLSQRYPEGGRYLRPSLHFSSTLSSTHISRHLPLPFTPLPFLLSSRTHTSRSPSLTQRYSTSTCYLEPPNTWTHLGHRRGLIGVSLVFCGGKTHDKLINAPKKWKNGRSEVLLCSFIFLLQFS